MGSKESVSNCNREETSVNNIANVKPSIIVANGSINTQTQKHNTRKPNDRINKIFIPNPENSLEKTYILIEPTTSNNKKMVYFYDSINR